MAYVNPDLSTDVARMVGEMDIMDTVAAEVAEKVKAEWLKHFWTGHIAASIRVERTPGKKGVTDRYIISDARGVVSAEFGHFIKNSTKFVYGIHAFGKISGGHWSGANW